MNDDEDEFGADAEFLEALAASDPTPLSKPSNTESKVQRINQPKPQRLGRPDQTSSIQKLSGHKVIQPTPQKIASHPTISSLLVSPRQKGNPILTNLRLFVWEYSDIPADYVLGLSTCALFLSLKYHRLHPEYMYNRIKGIQGMYKLRILLTLVDITNHEDLLKELTKSSLINNVTIILCWSAAEAARYLELYKSFEHSKESIGIKGIEKKGYAEKMMEFVTVPRGINKTDAVSIVSAFGSIKGAINARPEEVAVIGGWGEKKVRKWCSVIDEPFRLRKTQLRSKEDEEALLQKALPASSEFTCHRLREQNLDNLSSQGHQCLPNMEEMESTRLLEIKNNVDPADLIDKENLIVPRMEATSEKDEIQASHQNQEETSKYEELSSGLSTALAKLRRENN